MIFPVFQFLVNNGANSDGSQNYCQRLFDIYFICDFILQRQQLGLPHAAQYIHPAPPTLFIYKCDENPSDVDLSGQVQQKVCW
tara:strand:+ start:947 stop:1195 length:249 start_codon:yes stop_codon:yes gene_type:complete